MKSAAQERIKSTFFKNLILLRFISIYRTLFTVKYYVPECTCRLENTFQSLDVIWEKHNDMKMFFLLPYKIWKSGHIHFLNSTVQIKYLTYLYSTGMFYFMYLFPPSWLSIYFISFFDKFLVNFETSLSTLLIHLFQNHRSFQFKNPLNGILCLFDFSQVSKKPFFCLIYRPIGIETGYDTL